jgi:peptidoglycan/xylan/chitin deacetylase (PgdA/CDA1 family)
LPSCYSSRQFPPRKQHYQIPRILGWIDAIALNQGAIAWGGELCWQQKGEQIARVYRHVLDISRLKDAASSLVDGEWWEVFMRWSNWTKRVAGLSAAGLSLVLPSRAQSSVGILLYHRVDDIVPGLPQPEFSVSPGRFRTQLRGLQRGGYCFWPLGRLLDYHDRQEPVPAKTVVLTFDDGFESVYRFAYPVLKELNIPAVVFLVTAYLDSDEPFRFDSWGIAHRETAPGPSWRPLTSVQCREMLGSGLIELGSHTHTHRDFRGCAGGLARDLGASLGVLRATFGLDSIPFAFPYGRKYLGFAGGKLTAVARASGVRCALTTDCDVIDPREDPFDWGRSNVYEWDTQLSLAAKLAGWCRGPQRLQEKAEKVAGIFVRSGG